MKLKFWFVISMETYSVICVLNNVRKILKKGLTREEAEREVVNYNRNIANNRRAFGDKNFDCTSAFIEKE